MHLHTKGNSSCARTDINYIVKKYAKRGCDGIVCTNHFNKHIFANYLCGNNEDEKISAYLEGYNSLKKEAIQKGIDVFFGMEVALQKDHYEGGGKQSAEILVYGVTPEEIKTLGLGILDMTYAEFRNLSVDKGWTIYQAHPFRTNTKRIDLRYLDGLEIYNGNIRQKNRNEKTREIVLESGCLSIAGSDFHRREDPITAVLLDRKPTDEKDLAITLKKISNKDLKYARLKRKNRFRLLKY